MFRIENKKFWSTVESSSWYEYIHLFLKYSTEIAHHLRVNNILIEKKIKFQNKF